MTYAEEIRFAFMRGLSVACHDHNRFASLPFGDRCHEYEVAAAAEFPDAELSAREDAKRELLEILKGTQAKVAYRFVHQEIQDDPHCHAQEMNALDRAIEIVKML